MLLGLFPISAEAKILSQAGIWWVGSTLCQTSLIRRVPFSQISPALSVLTKLIYSMDDEVLIDACWAISYLSDGSNDKIQAVIESGVVRRLVELLM